jgi:hypothetical protein
MSERNENVRDWKFNVSFEGGGVSIRSEWKKSLNAVAWARNTYLLGKNKKTSRKQPMTHSRIEPASACLLLHFILCFT